MERVIIDTKKLSRYGIGTRMRIIRKTLRYLDAPYDRRYIESILTLLENNKTGKRLKLPRVEVTRDYDRLLIGKSLQREKVGKHKKITSAIEIGKSLCLPEGILETEVLEPDQIDFSEYKSNSKEIAYFDLDRLSLPIKVRYRAPGDLFKPFGYKGRKRLKKFLIDEKIPVYKRDSIPLVVDSADNIIWIAGIRRSNITPITDRTHRILVMRLKK